MSPSTIPSLEPQQNRSRRIAGSFRDPHGYVFRRDGEILRAIDDEFHGLARELMDDGRLDALAKRCGLIGTSIIEDVECLEALRLENPGFEHFLKHEHIDFISYPYEWSLSMLADAAVCTLDLQLALLESGLSLKDATPFNVQFENGQPRFIDVASIERPARLDVWYAMGQFTRTLLLPLLMCRHHGWNLRSYFACDPAGLEPEQALKGLGILQRWRPRMAFDVTLPAYLTRRARRKGSRGQVMLERSNTDPTIQRFNLGRLKKKVQRLATGYKPAGEWQAYTSTCSYGDRAQDSKRSLVGEYLQQGEPNCVLDVGCNTGDYSFLAAESGARVVAVDTDHDAIEMLYRRLREQPADILLLVVDMCNPTPAIGYRNRERESFLERIDGKADCVLALALIHHLHVNGNLSLPYIRDFFATLTTRNLILEFVPVEDQMFRTLTAFRREGFPDYSLESLKAIFEMKFRLVREDAIPNSPRTLLLFERREGSR